MSRPRFFALTMSMLALAASLSMLCACDGEADAEAAQSVASSAATQALQRVESHAIAEHGFRSDVELSANVLPKRQVKLIPRVPGVLDEVLVDEGDRVKAGQVVARLDRRDYLLGVKQAQAQLAAARANSSLASLGVRSASNAHKRMSTLHASQAISQSEMEKVDDGLEMGRAKRNAADAQAQLARVGLESARTKLADTVLRAPFDGLVVKRLLDEGDLCGVMPPGIVMLVADDSEMTILGTMSELHVGRVHEGMTALVRVDAYPGEPFRGTISLISPMVDARTRTSTVEVVVPNAEGRLEMGMSAEIEIDLGEHRAPAVPEDALIRSSSDRNRAEVFVVESGVASRRELRLGRRDAGLREVVNGLEPGDVVVRSGQAGLRDGQRVTVDDGERR